MWRLVVLCSVIALYGVQGDERFQTTAESSVNCDEYVYRPSGTIKSPNYPESYPNNVDCTWYIRPSGRTIVRLEFLSLGVENEEHCNFDAVYVYDGSYASGRLLGKLCGNKTATLYSTGTHMTVRFKSDYIGTYGGFLANFMSVVEGVCGEYSCGLYLGNCSCSHHCKTYETCCPGYEANCSPGTTLSPTTDSPSCRYNCRSHMGSCSCSSSCQYYGNCCHDYYSYCSSTTEVSPTARPSCLYNCGSYMGSCSCSSSCQYYGNCCHDYYSYCSSTTEDTPTARPSCRYNCGSHMGSCSCSSSCQYYGNCCHDYYSYCSSTTEDTPTARPSCLYNCGSYMGSCSCSSSCQYYGTCCHDYYSYCSSTTEDTPTARPSCRYNCGSHMGSCSCSSSCQYYGNCCHDYYSYCSSTTEDTPTARPSCLYNCGSYMGSCSCSSSCQYYGNCCHDYYSYCSSTTEDTPTARPSCRYNCGSYMGSCSCSSSCQYYGNCCHDYDSYCSSTTEDTPTARPSCLYNCGSHMGSCSCSSSCQYYGNCCHDYYSYCSSTTEDTPTARPSCRYNCGSHMGSCSCSSSCQYYGNCCHDYYSYCGGGDTTPSATESPCGGNLFGSGTFTSPNHPNYYHDYTNCVWQLRVSPEERLYLTFTYLQLENCCSCDYIAVYDGPSLNSRYLGKVCNDSLKTFHSSSNYLTVQFRTDSSVVGRGFSADFRNSLAPHLGRVDCSADNMNIVIQRSYLNSLGYGSHSLYLNNPHCRPQITSYEVIFNFPITTCGTIRETDSSRIIYANAIRADGSGAGEITRQAHFKLNVSCIMDQESVSQIMYKTEHNDNSSITGTGRFNTSMDFYTSSSFHYKVTEVPYRVKLNRYLYVQVILRRGDSSSLVLYLDTCVASPSPHDFQTKSYDLIRNGCPEDNTVHTYLSGTHSFARFRFKAFKFLRATEFVYIQCKVLICPSSDVNSRCRHTCNRREARDLESEHESQTVVLGPITLRGPEKKEEAHQEASA